jgi:hypothetical protein
MLIVSRELQVSAGPPLSSREPTAAHPSCSQTASSLCISQNKTGLRVFRRKLCCKVLHGGQQRCRLPADCGVRHETPSAQLLASFAGCVLTENERKGKDQGRDMKQTARNHTLLGEAHSLMIRGRPSVDQTETAGAWAAHGGAIGAGGCCGEVVADAWKLVSPTT